jgi:hypothetical protein
LPARPDIPPATVKRCTKCGREKPLAAFTRANQYRDGHKTQCKVCHAAYMHQWRRRNLDRARAKARLQNRRRRAWTLAYSRTPEHQRKQAIRKVTYWAVKTGLLPAKDRCERCGATAAQARLERHHPDYSRPLWIRWLCTTCHGEAHRKLRPD